MPIAAEWVQDRRHPDFIGNASQVIPAVFYGRKDHCCDVFLWSSCRSLYWVSFLLGYLLQAEARSGPDGHLGVAPVIPMKLAVRLEIGTS